MIFIFWTKKSDLFDLNQIFWDLNQIFGTFLEYRSKPLQKDTNYCFTLNQESDMNNCTINNWKIVTIKVSHFFTWNYEKN